MRLTMNAPESEPRLMNRRQAVERLASGFAGAATALVFGRSLAAQQTARSSSAAPSGAILRTILKDMSVKDLSAGLTLVHEHPGLAVPNDLNLLVTELQQARADGLALITDGAIGRRTPE